MSELFTAPFERLLSDRCPPAVVRQIEAGGSPRALWSTLTESGFLDALVPEAQGGAGLALAEAFPLFVAEGRHALPLPVAHTMLVRAVLAHAGQTPPDGILAIAAQARLGADGSITCAGTPTGLLADWIAVDRPVGTDDSGKDSNDDGGWWLLPAADARRDGSGIHGSLRADLHWPALPASAVVSSASSAWRDAGAALAAAQLAGALERVLTMTVDFANQREQFGRSIGKFQAIQHQLAQLAEHVAASRIAAQIGCSGAGLWPVPLRAALAKSRTSEAAALAAPMAHAVHGAIGVTTEFDLQLYTRRLHEWRTDFGAETHWNRVLGRALLADTGTTLDFMRQALIPPNQDLFR
ncbi:MAG: acyl-CoA dehydrogenase [Rubrivivax sp.]|nr:acyl-CoA dehydrogenase [Rubrivivax sp.]